ncbi:MAG: ribonuclease D [Rhodospirillales bacterium]
MPLTANGPLIELHTGDLPDGLILGDRVAIDTETTGLIPHRDRLCLVQLTDGDGVCHLVHFSPQLRQDAGDGFYPAPNLAALLANPETTKLFHFGRFDIGMLFLHLGVLCQPVYCTKIASRLVRTYTDRHGLKDLCRELLGVEISKEQQSSDWGAERLSEEQMRYAATDVIHLHRLADRLETMLVREGRDDLARACFQFLPERARLDVSGWPGEDIFAY